MNRLIALDFDGVIADTIPLLFETYNQFLGDYGELGTREEFDSCNGLSLNEIVKKLKEGHNLDESMEVLVEKYNYMMNSIVSKADYISGAERLIKKSHRAGLPIVITSSGTTDYIKSFLDYHGMEECISGIISADMVKKAKPQPDIYKKVIEDYPEYEVFAVEDSANGLLAAFNAGLKVIFFDANSRTDVEYPYHYRIHDLAEVEVAIEQISKEGYFVKAREVEVEIIDYKPDISILEEESIEEKWKNRPKGIYDGKIVAFHSYECNMAGKLVLKGFITDYKHMWYSKTFKTLKKPLITIAVSGVILDDDDNTLISDRRIVTDDSGKHELIPSGGIEADAVINNPLGYQQQILQELSEETGVEYNEDEVLISNIGICFDAKNLDVDICMLLRCNINNDSINSTEYVAGTLKKIHIEDAVEYISRGGVFTSGMILREII